MTSIPNPIPPPVSQNLPIRRPGSFDPLLGRIDLAAILITLLSLVVLIATALVLAVIQLAKVLPALWAEPVNRWVIIVAGVAIVWVLFRGKRLCVF